ncbi:telomere repeats-binding bouquet formation protein 2-like [Mya arenaria]|uniref:telomere repeats-binding bouquet formation protein 2-like n=1 Tax=Mya arenaria TaxID=6604 RepID=UPI0022E7EB52|nr:telomere repeats-binding bouquet formation protein 2-like [Mya arenaria]XP_052795548.1 telomere repeats-binding bouquet formation protein 2-like [Mya arenaria]XP_052795549.1 telomere repeats-binding bouquet formation protein 2-like [Mya arenaria]
MFSGQTAWFSKSVSRRKKKLWSDNGGEICGADKAQFIFSQDPTAQDTESIFDSESYLDEHLAIFHPNFVCECIKRGGLKVDLLGQYFFPPKDVQELARYQMQYKWDQDGHTSDGDSYKSESDDEHPFQQPTQPATKRKSTSPSKSPHKRLNTANIVKQKDPKPGTSHQNRDEAVNETSKDIEKLPIQTRARRKSERIVQNKSLNVSNNSQTVMNSPSKRQSVQVSPNKVHKSSKPATDQNKGTRPTDQEEHLRLEDLAKVSGDLEDFIVGQNGCELVMLN